MIGPLQLVNYVVQNRHAAEQEIKCAGLRQQTKEITILNDVSSRFFCPSASLAPQHGDFVPRYDD